MKTLRLDIDYPKRFIGGDNDAPKTAQDLSLSVIIAAVNLTYGRERQMSIQELRMWSRIQDKLMDQDGKPLCGDLELSPEQFDFLYAKVNEAKYPPQFAGAVTVLADYLDRVKVGDAAKS